MSLTQELERLAKLHAGGALTAEELKVIDAIAGAAK